MNKIDLIQKVKEKCNLSKQEAREVVEIFFTELMEAFKRGERVEIRGVCSFNIRDYKSYTGRNPKLEKKLQFPPRKCRSLNAAKNSGNESMEHDLPKNTIRPIIPRGTSRCH